MSQFVNPAKWTQRRAGHPVRLVKKLSDDTIQAEHGKLAQLEARVRELEAECARLRERLAARPLGETVRESSAQLYREIAQILDISADAIVGIDDRGLIRRFNRGAEIMFGYRSSEVIGRPLDILIPERYRKAHRGHLTAFARAPEVSRLKDRRDELYGLRKDGSEFPAEISIARLQAEGRQIFAAILRDISARPAKGKL